MFVCMHVCMHILVCVCFGALVCVWSCVFLCVWVIHLSILRVCLPFGRDVVICNNICLQSILFLFFFAFSLSVVYHQSHVWPGELIGVCVLAGVTHADWPSLLPAPAPPFPPPPHSFCYKAQCPRLICPSIWTKKKKKREKKEKKKNFPYNLQPGPGLICVLSRFVPFRSRKANPITSIPGAFLEF